MAITWNDKMKKVGPRGAGLEAETRQAVIAAVVCWNAMPEGTEPAFSGGHFLSPQNPAAIDLVNACTAHLGPEIAGRARREILTTAVTLAMIACGTGLRGAAAWARLAEKLGGSYTPPPQPAPAPASATEG